MQTPTTTTLHSALLTAASSHAHQIFIESWDEERGVVHSATYAQLAEQMLGAAAATMCHGIFPDALHMPLARWRSKLSAAWWSASSW